MVVLGKSDKDRHMQLDNELLKKAGAFGLVSTELAVYVGGGFAVGHFLDKKLGCAPLFSVSGSILGMVYAIRRIAVWYKKEIRDSQTEKPK